VVRGQWDRIIVENTELLGSALGEARMIDPGSALRYLGTQVDIIDVVFASPGTVTLPEQVT